MNHPREVILLVQYFVRYHKMRVSVLATSFATITTPLGKDVNLLHMAVAEGMKTTLRLNNYARGRAYLNQLLEVL